MSATPNSHGKPDDAEALRAMRNDVLDSIRRLVSEDAARRRSAAEMAEPGARRGRVERAGQTDDLGLSAVAGPLTTQEKAAADSAPLKTTSTDRPPSSWSDVYRQKTEADRLRVAALRAAIKARNDTAEPTDSLEQDVTSIAGAEWLPAREGRQREAGSDIPALRMAEPEPMDTTVVEAVPDAMNDSQDQPSSSPIAEPEEASTTQLVGMVREILQQELRRNSVRVRDEIRAVVLDEVAHAFGTGGLLTCPVGDLQR